RIPTHEPGPYLRIRPRNNAVNVIVLSSSVVDELVGNLHHPVRAAFGVRHHEHVLRAGNIVSERVFLFELPLAKLTYVPEYAFGTAEHFERPDGRSGESVNPQTGCPLNDGMRRPPFVRRTRYTDGSFTCFGCHAAILKRL